MKKPITGILIALSVVAVLLPTQLANAGASRNGSIRYQIYKSGAEFTAWADAGYGKVWSAGGKIVIYQGDFAKKTVYCYKGSRYCQGSIIISPAPSCSVVSARFYLYSSSGYQVLGSRLNSC